MNHNIITKIKLLSFSYLRACVILMTYNSFNGNLCCKSHNSVLFSDKVGESVSSIS